MEENMNLFGNNFDKTAFMNNIWGQEFWHLIGKETKFERVFSYEDFSNVLNYSHKLLTYPTFRIVKDGNIIPEAKYVDFEKNIKQGAIKKINIHKVELFCRNGATIVISGIGTLCKSLKQLESYIEDLFGYPAQINSYYTSKISQGFNLHYDTHDVIILQVEGSKEWTIYNEATYKYPLSEQPYFNKERPAGEGKTILMKKGDILYIPRGFWHYAKTNDESSLHLTIDVFVKTGIDFIQWMVNFLKQEEDFRKELSTNPENLNKILYLLQERVLAFNNNKEMVLSHFKDSIISEINLKNKQFSFPII